MHTPGPWKIEPEPGVTAHEHVDIIGATGWIVAEQVELNADARLIAAAPDLLEAAQRLSALADSIWAPMSDQEAILLHTAFGKLDFAIAKATAATDAPELTQAQIDEQAKLWDGGSELIRS